MIHARYRRIVFFFARVLLQIALMDLLLPRLGLGRRSRQSRSERFRRYAAAFRRLAIEMGGVLIKVGQFLSSRVDVLPEEITTELAGLQDEVPPVPFDQIRTVLETEFGTRLEERYLRFEAEPLAAASLGQAHLAWLVSPFPNQAPGVEQAVVVKVQRPRIEELIATDLAALRTVGDWLRRYPPIKRRANVPALLEEFTRILYQEIDYLGEGRNAETFAENFKDAPVIRVPRVVWSHTTRRVLTLEDVYAIKITDYRAIDAAGISRQAVASRLLNTYLKQIFEDGFFHADPHPGNLFVQPTPGQQPANGSMPEYPTPSSATPSTTGWQLTFVDFGMVGHVPPHLQEGLRDLLIGIGSRNPNRVIQAYQKMGVLLPGTDLSLLEKAGAEVFDRFWGKSMSELREVSMDEIQGFVVEFRDLIYSMPFQIPQDIIFMGRAIGILSGLCTGLDPDFNFWAHLAPYAQKMVAQEAVTGAESILTELGALVRSLIAVPQKLDSLLSRVDRGEIAVRAPEISSQVNKMESAIRQVAGGILFAALLLGGIQLYLAKISPFAEVLLAGAGIALIWTIIAGMKR